MCRGYLLSIHQSTHTREKTILGQGKNHSKGAEEIVFAAHSGLGAVLVANIQNGKIS